MFCRGSLYDRATSAEHRRKKGRRRGRVDAQSALSAAFTASPIQNNSDLAQGPLPIRPLKSGVATSIWRQEGYMAPKPKPARFEFTVGMVLAMALTILVVMTWAVAAPSSSAIYHPQLLLLY